MGPIGMASPLSRERISSRPRGANTGGLSENLKVKLAKSICTYYEYLVAERPMKYGLPVYVLMIWGSSDRRSVDGLYTCFGKVSDQEFLPLTRS